MKKFLTFFLVSAFFAANSQEMQVQVIDSITVPPEQQINHIFQHVNFAEVTSHLLIDKAFQICQIENYTGETPDTNNAVTYSKWQNLYGTLFSAALEPQYRLPSQVISYLALTKYISRMKVFFNNDFKNVIYL